MLELTPVGPRLKIACEAAGFGRGGDTAAARAALQVSLGISAAAVSKLFSGESSSLNTLNVFRAAELLNVDPRWLATGVGEMKPARLPSDVIDVARILHGIQDPAVRRAAIAMARVVATDPVGQIATIMGGLVDAKRWSPTVQHIADGLEAMDDGALKRLAIAWATTAAFNPDRLPQDKEPQPKVPAHRANDKRTSKS